MRYVATRIGYDSETALIALIKRSRRKRGRRLRCDVRRSVGRIQGAAVCPLLLCGIALRINKLEGVGINSHPPLINNIVAYMK